MDAILQPIPGHSIFLLLVQLGLLLFFARVLAEGMRRIGQPAVIGELLAGILLGPTILGHFAPDMFMAIFPPSEIQFQYLEVISWLGMVMLLLLTGLETDIRTMRTIGKPAVLTSLSGITVTATSGAILGIMLPDVYLTDPANRPIFAAFLATAMAITAMPVIAKILIDLNLIKRNIGVVILSAGVMDDTIGWLALSIIAGIAAGGAFALGDLMLTLLLLVLFIIILRWVAFPVMSRGIRFANERVDLVGSDITLILVFTFAAASFTEFIGIHAVFGAFAAGLLVRQLPRVRRDSLHTIESFVLAGLSPIFFAFVGLKVDLWALTSWSLPLLVIGVAVSGKLVGCYLGGRFGGMSHWESLALGFGMNARGAMELIVAMIGLSLGLLTQEMYSTIVLLAVVTSFMAPILIRLVVPRLPITDEERARMQPVEDTTLFGEGAVRTLIPTAGGKNALEAFRVAGSVARSRGGEVTALYVETESAPSKFPWLRKTSLAGTNLEAHLKQAQEIVVQKSTKGKLTVRRIQAPELVDAVLDESKRDYDLLMLGAAAGGALGDGPVGPLVAGSDIPVVIVRGPRKGLEREAFKRILVPIDGSRFSRLAADFAGAIAAENDAQIVFLHVVNAHRFATGSLTVVPSDPGVAPTKEARQQGEMVAAELAPVAARHGVSYDTRVLMSGSPEAVIVAQCATGEFDLLVLGAENKIMGQPLFSGQGTAEILRAADCTTAVVIPSR